MSMIAAVLLAASAVLPVLADPVPLAPAPGDIFNEGTQCKIAWTPDTTGTWKTMNIELMTGANEDMVHLSTVATLDGTDPTQTPFNYPCLSVTPNSAIYFYQFTSPASSNKTWTGRFAIADASGNTTPPSNANQPEGGSPAIPWGTGALTDPSQGTPPPGSSNSTTGSSSIAVSTSGSSPSSVPLANSPSSSTTNLLQASVTPSSTGSTTGTGSTSSGPSSTGSGGTTSAAAPHSLRAAITLGALLGSALIFVVVL